MLRSLGLLALISTTVFAQVPAADLEQVWLEPAGRGSLWVGDGHTLHAGEFRGGASLTFGYGPMRSASAGNQALVSDRFGLQVFAALGVFDWLELSAVIPAILYQRGSETLPVAQAGLGNPWVNVRIPIWNGHDKPVLLSAGLGVGVPVGTGLALGNGGVAFAPRINAGHVFRDVQFGLELSGVLRSTVDYSARTGEALDVIGSQVSLAAMLTSVTLDGPRGEGSVRVFTPLTGGRIGVEALIGVRWPMGDVEFFAAAGPGLFGEPSTPQARAYLGASFSNVKPTRAACIEGLPYELAECPDLDQDGDGVPNVRDEAPLEAEDRDGFQDGDGKPDPDDDGDGVLDVDDACRNERGPVENRGCPDLDGDGDGFVDRKDACPTQAGLPENGGCPDVDLDVDGVVDRLDRCPGVTGATENAGCPWPDTDGDGVIDREDNCPSASGTRLNQGCPVEQRQLVILTPERLATKEKVLFDGTRATIQKRSAALLDNVAAVLVAHPEFTRVRVEAHTDSSGKAEANRALSQARANAVRDALVQRGVAAGRLEAVGAGGEQPQDTNDTPDGRENNRRVEFLLITAP
ncbi:MAG: OmpA family protein [Myxococcus sp.]|nr:OmpA family protein [Myxococcus sp.]